MSHRVYLYNATRIDAPSDADRMVIEWSYEVPPMLHPLLSSPARVARNHYNNDDPDDDVGLFYDTAAGIASLRRFHDFLARHPRLVRDPEAFAAARERLSTCLDALPHPWLHLDVWDVLNMDDAPHAVQIEQWREALAHNSRIIEAAIAADDPDQLLHAPLAMLTPGFDDFAALIAHPAYEYGAAALCDWSTYDADANSDNSRIFEHEGRYGLRDGCGEVLQPAVYDDIFGFDTHGYSVASRDGRFLHLDRAGNIRGGRDWDDAYDFEGDAALAIVRDGAGYGAIALDGAWAIAPLYDNLGLLDTSPSRYAANRTGKHGVLDSAGNVLIPLEHASEFTCHGGLLHAPLPGSGQSAVFTVDGVRIADADIRSVGMVAAPYDAPGWIEVRRHNRFPVSRLHALDGRVIAEGIDPILPGDAMPELLLVRRDGRHAAVDRGRQRLPFAFDLLRDLRGEHRGDAVELLLAERDGLRGVLAVDDEAERWLVALGTWHEITWLHHGLAFALRGDDGWRLAGAEGDVLPGVRFERIGLVPGSARVYGLADGRPWRVRCDGPASAPSAITPLDAPEVELAFAVFDCTDPLLHRHLVAHGLQCDVDDPAVDAFLADPVEQLLRREAG